jgi:predicted nucleotidyltransferase
MLKNHESASDTKAADDPILAEIVSRLVGVFAPEQIYLFGSHARGEAGPDSDYDLLVVVRSSILPRYRRDQAAFEALRGVGVAKDVLVLTHDEFARQRTVICSLPATVEREGVLLYAA